MDGLMSSRVLSRFLPVAEGDVSVYEGMRRQAARHPDVEAQRHRRPHEPFHDDEEENPENFLYDVDQQTPTDTGQSPEMMASTSRPQGQDARTKRQTVDDEDVPESLLLEPKAHRATSRPVSKNTMDSKIARAEAQWRATQEQQGLHHSRAPRSARPTSRPSQGAAPPQNVSVDPRANAMWLYTNATNLDNFLVEVYQYFQEHGFASILLARIIKLSTEAFVFGFAMFLTTCIDYSKIPTSKSTTEVMIPKCMAKASWIKSAALFFFIIYLLNTLFSHIGDIGRLRRMRDFYVHVLGITEDDIQTVSWVRVVDGLVKIQNANMATANPSAQVRKYLDYHDVQQRLSAESIANRLMRRANYYVAMYNKDIIDFSLPLPWVGMRQFYSKSLEWAIEFCLTNFIFDEKGGIRVFCLDVKNRSALVTTLRTRLRTVALIGIFVAPLNIIRFCVLYFFRYYTEFTKNPSRASARAFTPHAEWKIREFNELDHLFQRRIRQAAPFANDYLRQFPKDKTDQLARFVAFVSGAIAAVLALATLFDPELFLGFEVTPGRTAVFWLTVTSVIFTVAQGSLPDDNEVHDPVLHLKEVLLYTHYMPGHWKERLHSNEVREEFSAMFQLKVVIFVEEILSLIVAPWILWRNSTLQSERIIDFFREQTVHVEGIGYQCNFAVFGFKKDSNAEDPTQVLAEGDGLRDDYYGVKDDKMAQSVQNFAQYYSHYNHRPGHRRVQGWQPPPAWPPVISPPSIAEEPGPSTGGVRRTPPNARKSTTLPDRHLHSASVLHLPHQTARGFTPRRGKPQRSDETTRHGVAENRLMAQDSDLQDYADAPGAADQLDSDTDDDEGAYHGPTGANAGVLGMLAQYSKAQNDKGPGIVNI
ncbi:autophagy-related 9 [Lecanosticta acicola]|uniref:Autophagy-related protein 9 n=1 Tax=Lecanosticta acicola TaxID=111012 RepID=A0AAI8Z959_9PEZI|nr:autophagy-related 9 [Lecanosticta acicola]